MSQSNILYISFKRQNKLSIFKILNMYHDPCTDKKIFVSKRFIQVKSFFDKF